MSEEENKELKQNKFSPKKIAIGLGIIAVTFLGIYGYYIYNKIYPSTDNAYVDADIINISAKVGGYIETVYVKNNSYVHKGDKLLQIDRSNYELQVAQATAALEEASGQLEAAKEQISIASYNLAKSESGLEMASHMATRYNELFNEGAGSQQDAQKYTDQKTQALKAVEQAKSSLKQAGIQATIAKAQVDAASVGLSNAKLNLSYTSLTAPADGFISNLKIYSGQLIAPGQPLFGFIDDKKWWVNANFKETDIARIKPGQKVSVKLDMYSHTYTGTVDSLSYATGSVFSLLPAENATGNWVKVTQRFPIKIVLEDSQKYPLRVGASATVKVDTI
ncbi:HlyD family secretion protein [Pseudofrancisella aestuarii]|uniref:HlyD family secretion protein n=1 Tax=Pseudofrancisella aestuarii TaxID=2670347 RepID=A0ABV9TB17_9GAMM|nr:HlyD family secretion protein [Pseudofrancisella aestuarii]